MNKKFLSAILFGALMATSAGTFVSCKDYDDDIKNLQTQIDTNKTAIAELQKLVGAGKWVSSISSIENGFTVTMSDGSSHQIKGINGKDGADGKNGAEWTIGEDGFWYVDGEKTENVAVAKDGKDGLNGVSAPAPYISEDGMWVVYSWDAEKGEFVAEETEIPAAGLCAYAVKANGVYTLFIADENGELQEIALPATSDSFVVSAPSGNVALTIQNAIWNAKTLADTKEKKADYAVLEKAFPEIATLKKGDKMIQGNELPFLVNPLNVDMTEGFTYTLVDDEFEVLDIELSNPVKGISKEWDIDNGSMSLGSRAADPQAGFWTLTVAPAFDKKKGYASADDASLIVTNAKGVSSRTALAYDIEVDEEALGNVLVAPLAANLSVEFAETIDLMDAVYGANEDAPAFTITNGYTGKYVLLASSSLQVEQYDLTIEGSKLTIGNMPENKTSIDIKLEMIALGLNGSTAHSEVLTLTVGQKVEAAKEFDAKEVTLNAKNQEVRWAYEALSLSALQLHNLYADGYNFQIIATREADKLPAGNVDGEYEDYIAFNGALNFYNAKNKVTEYDAEDEEWSQGEPATFGFDVDASAAAANATIGTVEYKGEGWLPATYTLNIAAVKSGSTSVLYTAESELTVKNPALTADYVKLVSAFVSEDVFQITGDLSTEGKVEYNLSEALIINAKNEAAFHSAIDLDNRTYTLAGGEANTAEYASYNWVGSNKLSVNTWVEEPEVEPATPWYAAQWQQLYQTRNIRAYIKLFNNSENLVAFDFTVVVKSEIYSEDGSSVTADATKLKAKFTDDPTTTTVTETQIKLANAFTAKAVAGVDAGKTYKLFATKGGATSSSSTTYDYRDFESMGNYVKGTDGNVITFSTANAFELQTLKNLAGDTNADVDYTVEDVTYKLLSTDWTVILNQIQGYVNQYGKADYLTENNKVVTVKYPKFKVNADESVEFVLKDGKFDWQEGKVYAGNENAYNAIKHLSGVCTSSVDAVKVHAVTVIPEDDETAGIYVNRWIALFNAYKSQVKCKSTTVTTNGTAADTPRDSRIASVKFAFDQPEEAAKFFSNTTDANGFVFVDKYDSELVLNASLAEDVDLTSGKVIVGMKLYVTDAWGMTMVVPFNVEVSTK